MFGRTWFLILMFVGGLAAVVWAVYGSRLPPADFSFTNETEIATVDPALATGQPEMRIIQSLFEGLGRQSPKNTRFQAGSAEKWEISEDGRVYTFHLRDNAMWSNGEPVTAHDFEYSIRRLLRSANLLALRLRRVVPRQCEEVYACQPVGAGRSGRS